MKLVLITGVQHQIDEMLQERGMQPRYVGGYRITDRETLKIVTEAVGDVRTQCEQVLSKVNAACTSACGMYLGFGPAWHRRVERSLSP